MAVTGLSCLLLLAATALTLASDNNWGKVVPCFETHGTIVCPGCMQRAGLSCPRFRVDAQNCDLYPKQRPTPPLPTDVIIETTSKLETSQPERPTAATEPNEKLPTELNERTATEPNERPPTELNERTATKLNDRTATEVNERTATDVPYNSLDDADLEGQSTNKDEETAVITKKDLAELDDFFAKLWPRYLLVPRRRFGSRYKRGVPVPQNFLEQRPLEEDGAEGRCRDNSDCPCPQICCNDGCTKRCRMGIRLPPPWG